MIVLDQLTNELERFRRAVAIIPGQKRDLAPVDATAFVDSLEVGALNAAQYRIAGSWAAKGRVLPNLDLGVRCAGIMFLLRECADDGPAKTLRRSAPATRSRSTSPSSSPATLPVEQIAAAAQPNKRVRNGRLHFCISSRTKFPSLGLI
jgi:hypothetical protein